MDKYWLEICDDKGKESEEAFPKNILNYVNMSQNKALPRVGDTLEIILNVTHNGEHDGRFEFEVVKIKREILQSLPTINSPNETNDSIEGYSTVYIKPIYK